MRPCYRDRVEVIATAALKRTDGFARMVSSLVTVAGMALILRQRAGRQHALESVDFGANVIRN